MLGKWLLVIRDLRSSVCKVLALAGYGAAFTDIELPTFRESTSVQSSTSDVLTAMTEYFSLLKPQYEVAGSES